MAFMYGVSGASVTSRDNLRQHELRHKNIGQYKCETCGNISFSKANASMHEVSHKTQKTFTCMNCGKKFACQGYLDRHIRKEMGLGNSFKCNICD